MKTNELSIILAYLANKKENSLKNEQNKNVAKSKMSTQLSFDHQAYFMVLACCGEVRNAII